MSFTEGVRQVVALYVGTKGRLDEDRVLVEVFVTHDLHSGQPSGYSYQAYELNTGTPVESAPHGSVGIPYYGADPPGPVRDQFSGRSWNRLR